MFTYPIVVIPESSEILWTTHPPFLSKYFLKQFEICISLNKVWNLDTIGVRWWFCESIMLTFTLVPFVIITNVVNYTSPLVLLAEKYEHYCNTHCKL